MSDVQDDSARIWAATLRSLQEAGIPAPQRAFLAQCVLVGVLDSTAIIAVPDEFTKEIVESRARDRLVRALTEQVGHEVRLAVTVDASLREQFAGAEQPVLEGYQESMPGELAGEGPSAAAEEEVTPATATPTGERLPRPAPTGRRRALPPG